MTTVFRSPFGILLVFLVIVAVLSPFVMPRTEFPVGVSVSNSSGEDAWTNPDGPITSITLNLENPLPDKVVKGATAVPNAKGIGIDITRCDESGVTIWIVGTKRTMKRDLPDPCDWMNVAELLRRMKIEIETHPLEWMTVANGKLVADFISQLITKIQDQFAPLIP